MAVFILYTNHKFNKSETTTGGIRRFLELLNGLLEKGNEIHLFCPVDASLKSHPNLVRHDIKSVIVNYIPPSITLFIANYRSIRNTISAIHYDAVIAMDIPYVIQLVLMKIPKIIFMLRQDFVEGRLLNSKLKKGLFRKIYLHLLVWAEKKTLIGAHKVIVQSKISLDTLLLRHPKIAVELCEKVRVVPNNVNPGWIKEHTTIKKDDLVFNKKNNLFTICFIGNVNKLKGLEILLNAVEELLKESYPVKLLVVGDGEYLSEFVKRYEKYPAIFFYGKSNHAIDYLMASDLLVVPSILDAFPNTIMEALYFEKPVIGSNRGGIPEMLKYPELIFEPGVGILSKRLKEIIDNNLIEDLRGLCIKRKEYFTFDWVREIEKCVLDPEAPAVK
jgi:glycosyltransferase involved in cell wall biosynthesis